MKTYKQAKQQFDREYTVTALHETRGNVTEAARRAGKDRKDFYVLMERAKITPGHLRILRGRK